MRHATVLELAKEQGIFLPDALTDHWPPQLSAADEKGWFRFQRLYDVARQLLPPGTIEMATDPAAGRWRDGYLYSRAATIYGGTAEVQRNIIAKRLLDLGDDQ